MQVELHQLNNMWDEEILKRLRAEEKGHNLSRKVQGIKRKANDMKYAHITSMGNVQDKVWSYPDEIGKFHRSIARARVIAITEKERIATIAHRIT